VAKGIQAFREAGLTKVDDEGKERFYIHSAEQDPLGRRVYCVIAADMSINELVPMTPQEMTLVKIKYGDRMVIEDWTETFNIQPSTLENLPEGIYGKGTSKQYKFKDLMQLGTLASI
jgi:hypothetical protein